MLTLGVRNGLAQPEQGNPAYQPPVQISGWWEKEPMHPFPPRTAPPVAVILTDFERSRAMAGTWLLPTRRRHRFHHCDGGTGRHDLWSQDVRAGTPCKRRDSFGRAVACMAGLPATGPRKSQGETRRKVNFSPPSHGLEPGRPCHAHGAWLPSKALAPRPLQGSPNSAPKLGVVSSQARNRHRTSLRKIGLWRYGDVLRSELRSSKQRF